MYNISRSVTYILFSSNSQSAILEILSMFLMYIIFIIRGLDAQFMNKNMNAKNERMDFKYVT